MSKRSKPNEAKYFKYQFSSLILLLSALVYLLCGAGIAVSVYRIVKFGVEPTFLGALKSPLLIGICLFCILLITSILIKSQYVVDDTYYTTQFGFIKSKFLIKEITALELDTDTQKLTLFIGEQYFVLSLNSAWQDEFIAAIRKVNPNVDFTFTLAETNGKTKKK